MTRSFTLAAILALAILAFMALDSQACIIGKRLRGSQTSSCTSKSTTTTKTTESVKQTTASGTAQRVKFRLLGVGTCSGGFCR